jgi:hypothetical protein
MIRLDVTVQDIAQAIAAGYTAVRVYTDIAEAGTFATLDGTVTLARRYGLSWLGGALLVLAVLYVWKAHATLVPRRTDEPAGGRVLAAPEAPGRPLVRLMRAGTSPAAALRACVEEFERSQPGQTAGQEARQQARQQAGSAMTDQEAVEAFGRICEQVNRKRTMT